MSFSHSAIVASIPGRLRLQDPQLRKQVPRKALMAALEKIDGVLSVDANPTAGSVLLRYAAGGATVAAMEQQVAAAAAQVLIPAGHAAQPSAPAPVAHATRLPADFRRSPLHRANRAAKIGMLAALPISLGFVATGNKQVHAIAGAAFTALLLVHLAMHRKRLTQ